MKDLIEKLEEDLLLIEKDRDDIQQLRDAQAIRTSLQMAENDEEYIESVQVCLDDNIDNVIEVLDRFTAVLEMTDLMSDKEFAQLEDAIISMKLRLEKLK